MPWFWDQDGKTLKVVTRESNRRPLCFEGPFATEADALRDALSEYRKTVSLYDTAIKDAESRR